MWKALLKKQFRELITFYFPKAKAGKKRGAGAMAGFAILFLFVVLSLGASFYASADMLAAAMLPMGLDWLYFALFGDCQRTLGEFAEAMMQQLPRHSDEQESHNYRSNRVEHCPAVAQENRASDADGCTYR